MKAPEKPATHLPRAGATAYGIRRRTLGIDRLGADAVVSGPLTPGPAWTADPSDVRCANEIDRLAHRRHHAAPAPAQE